HAGGPYRVPPLRQRSRIVYTNNPPTSAMRGFGGLQVVFGYEPQMDRLARALGMDPASCEKRNAIAKRDRLPVRQEIETDVRCQPRYLPRDQSQSVEGQIRGAVAMRIGQVLMEEVRM